MYVPARKYQEIYGVSTLTLRRWADAGKVEFIRSPGNHRLYKLTEETRAKAARNPSERQRIVYIRVSSAKQKDDLERQRAFMAARYPGHRVVSDIGSGINWRRKGLLSILESAMSGDVEEVVVASRDRLCRFAFELIERVLCNTGTRLTVLEHADQSPEQELSDDLLSIVQIFCCRKNGRRRYRSDGDAAGEAESNCKSEGSAE